MTDIIKYLYRHGRIREQLLGSDRSITIDKLVDIYLLADEYDIPRLRRSTVNKLSALASRQMSCTDTTTMNDFVDCIARICGPDSLQFADNAMRARVMEICQNNSILLLKNKTFVQRYTKGGLFDVGSATAFGVGLGGRLLTSSGIAAGEAGGFPNVKSSPSDYHTADRYVGMVYVLKNVRLIYEIAEDS